MRDPAPGAASAAELIAEAMAALAAGEQDRAYQALVEVFARIERGVPIDPDDAFDATWLYVDVLLDRGQAQQAARVFADLATRPALGWYQTVMLAVIRGRMLAGLGHWRAAETCLLEIFDHHGDPGSFARWPALLALSGAGSCAAELGHLATAEKRLQQAFTRMVADFGPTNPAVLQTGVELAEVRVRRGATEQLPALLDVLDDGAAAVLGRSHPLRARLTALRAATATPAEAEQDDAAQLSPGGPDEPPPGGGAEPVTRSRQRTVIVLLLLLTAVLVALGVVAAAAVARAAPQRPAPVTPAGTACPRAAADRPARPPVSEANQDVVHGDLRVSPSPTAVRIASDGVTTATVAWAEHSGGILPAAMTAVRDGPPPAVVATVHAATTQATLTGLDPRSGYCRTVATRSSPTNDAWLERACPNRPR